MALDTMNCTVDNLNGILLNAVSQIVSPIWLFALPSDSSSLQGNSSFHFRTKEHMWSRGSAHFELVSTAVPKNATSSRSGRQAGTPRPRSVRAGLLYRKGGEVAQNRLVVCVSRLPLLPPKLTDPRPSAIKAPTPSSLPQRLRRVSQDSDSLRLVSLYSPAPPAMHFLDPFLREDLFHFVEAIIHSIDTPASSPANPSSPPSTNDEKPFELPHLQMRIPKRKFVAIVGKVGSGKSSVLQALTGEMRRVSGSVRITSLSLCFVLLFLYMFVRVVVVFE